MADSTFGVTVSAGTLRPSAGSGVAMAHRWTPGGVTIEADFTGAHLLHLAVAGCVLNDLYREAGRSGIVVDGALVRADGAFEAATWASTGIQYEVEVDTTADPAAVERLVRLVDDVAEIPMAVRVGTTVVRAPNRAAEPG